MKRKTQLKTLKVIFCGMFLFYLLKISLISLYKNKRKFEILSTPRFINTHIIEIMIIFEHRFHHFPKNKKDWRSPKYTPWFMMESVPFVF